MSKFTSLLASVRGMRSNISCYAWKDDLKEIEKIIEVHSDMYEALKEATKVLGGEEDAINMGMLSKMISNAFKKADGEL